MPNKKIKAIAEHVQSYLEQGIDISQLEQGAKEQGLSPKEWKKVLKSLKSKNHRLRTLFLVFLGVLIGYIVWNSIDISEQKIEDEIFQISLIDNPTSKEKNAWYDLRNDGIYSQNYHEISNNSSESIVDLGYLLENFSESEINNLIEGYRPIFAETQELLAKNFEYPNSYWEDYTWQNRYQAYTSIYELQFIASLQLYELIQQNEIEKSEKFIEDVNTFFHRLLHTQSDLMLQLSGLKGWDLFHSNILTTSTKFSASIPPANFTPEINFELLLNFQIKSQYFEFLNSVQPPTDLTLLAHSPFHFQTNRSKRIIADMFYAIYKPDILRKTNDKDIQKLIEKSSFNSKRTVFDEKQKRHIRKKSYISRNGIGKTMFSFLNFFTPLKQTDKNLSLKMAQEFRSLNQALNNYALKNSTYPDSLESLVPKYIAKIPNASISGDTIKYHPQAQILYSNGEDGIDNGGIDSLKWWKKMFKEKPDTKTIDRLRTEIGKDIVYSLRTITD